jgi:hypothetical protein
VTDKLNALMDVVEAIKSHFRKIEFQERHAPTNPSLAKKFARGAGNDKAFPELGDLIHSR